jgi:hypothetical protein
MAAGIRARTAQHSQREAGYLENISPPRHPSHHALAAAGKPASADIPLISAHLNPHPLDAPQFIMQHPSMGTHQ